MSCRVITVCVEVARGGSPILLQVLGVGAKLLILRHRHLMDTVEKKLEGECVREWVGGGV